MLDCQTIVTGKLTFVLFVSLFTWSCSRPIPPIPTPTVQGFDPEVRDAILTAHKQALAEPASGQASGRLGMVLQAHAVYPTALLAYERAIRLEPKEFAWRYYHALVVWQLSGPEKALRPLDDAIKLRPEYAPAVLKKADALFQLGRFQESEEAYKSVQNEAEGLYGIARVKHAEHDLVAAEDFYSRAIRAYPNYAAAYYGLATAQRGLGRESDAQKNFDMAQRYGKDHPPSNDPLAADVAALATGVYRNLVEGDQLAHQGNVDDAARLNEALLARDPESFTAILNLLYLSRFVERLGGQVDSLYAKAVKINPDVPVIYIYYGAALARQAKFDAASVAARKAVELRPDDSEAHILLGELMEAQNRPAEAIEEYKRAQSAEPRVQLKLWRLEILQGRSGEAIPELLAALSADDSYAAFRRVLLGEAYLTTGDAAKARIYLEQARSRAPEMAAQIDQELAQIARAR